jgi:hypothetical protein
MFALWLSLSVVGVALLGLFVFLMLRKSKDTKPPLSYRLAVTDAKRAMQEEEPSITVASEDGTRIPFTPAKSAKKQPKHGNFRLICDSADITYTAEEYTDEAIIALPGYDEHVTLMFTEGELSGIWIGKEALSPDSFDMRQGKASASNLRKLIRYHLRLPGGTKEL